MSRSRSRSAAMPMHLPPLHKPSRRSASVRRFYALRLARRELRGGMSGLGVFLGCLVLGVGAIAAIGSIAASVTAAIKSDARDLLGGDAEARLAYRPADASEKEFLATS